MRDTCCECGVPEVDTRSEPDVPQCTECLEMAWDAAALVEMTRHERLRETQGWESPNAMSGWPGDIRFRRLIGGGE